MKLLSTQLKDDLEKFVQLKGNKKKLDALFEFANERGRCGFEKWLQFELILFFRSQGAKVKPEKKTSPDKRKNTTKAHFQTDIFVELPSGKTLGLELKVRRVARLASRALQADIEKHKKTLKSAKATANFSVVLCGEDIDETQRKELSKKLSDFYIIKAGKHAYFLIAEEGA